MAKAKSVWSILIDKPRKKGGKKKPAGKSNAWQNYVSGGKRR
jgi:hypothetical protein